MVPTQKCLNGQNTRRVKLGQTASKVSLTLVNHNINNNNQDQGFRDLGNQGFRDIGIYGFTNLYIEGFRDLGIWGFKDLKIKGFRDVGYKGFRD